MVKNIFSIMIVFVLFSLYALHANAQSINKRYCRCKKRNPKLNKNADAVGYNIRYGTEPNKLYENYQVFGVDSLTIHSLSKFQKYYFTIDAFNENGITKGKESIETK